MKNLQAIFTAFGMAFLTWAGIVAADEVTKEGYAIDSNRNLIKNSYNECLKAGHWTPAMAIFECDPGLVKKEEPPKAEIAPSPVEPSPSPVAVPEEPVFVPITLQAEKLFDFNQSVIRPDGQKVLAEEVVSKLRAIPESEVIVTGHADRIGSEAYNMGLSQRRADAVKAYLVEQGIESHRIQTVAKGETEPVVSCKNVKGESSSRNRVLVECLRPNRRVVVEVKGQEQVHK